MELNVNSTKNNYFNSKFDNSTIQTNEPTEANSSEIKYDPSNILPALRLRLLAIRC